MKPSTIKILALSAVIATIFATLKIDHAAAAAEPVIAVSDAGPVARWAGRALARVEGWISRVRNKLDGRNGAMMSGCGEMMAGNGMM